MSRFIKDAAKGAADIGSNVLKGAVSKMLTEIAGDILKETGAQDIAKEKIVEVGTKVIGQMDMDVKNIQRELLKQAIKKELNL